MNGPGGDEASSKAAVPLVANDQIKLTTTYLNGVAIATFAIGGLAPLVALVSGSTRVSALAPIVILNLVCTTSVPPYMSMRGGS